MSEVQKKYRPIAFRFTRPGHIVRLEEYNSPECYFRDPENWACQRLYDEENLVELESELAALREELAEIKESTAYRGSLLGRTEQRLADAERRNVDVERALSGLLFEFDDGVNGGRDEPVAALDYARTLVDGAEFKPTESGASE